MRFKVGLSFLMLAAIALPLGAEILLVSPKSDADVSEMAPELKRFLSLPKAERRTIFNDAQKRAELRKLRNACPTEFVWQCTAGEKGPFKLEFSFDPGFAKTEPVLCLVREPNLTCRDKAVNFRLGQTYFWRVVGRDAQSNPVTSGVGKFKVDSATPRLLFVPNISNMRDLGGRKGLNGKTLRQGLIYRSAGLNANSPKYKKSAPGKDPATFPIGKTYLTADGITFFVRGLGIVTDLDLRSAGEIGAMRGSPAGADVKWVWNPSRYYAAIFRKNGKKAMAANFRLFCDKTNYPIDFHCIAGADRTGSLAYVLEGVLGVDEDEMEKDWQITANAYFGYGEGKADFLALTGGFQKYGNPGDSICRRIELYLADCGITPEEIAAFRAIMLE